MESCDLSTKFLMPAYDTSLAACAASPKPVRPVGLRAYPLRPLRRRSTLRGFGGFGAFCALVGSGSGSLGAGLFVSRSVMQMSSLSLGLRFYKRLWWSRMILSASATEADRCPAPGSSPVRVRWMA